MESLLQRTRQPQPAPGQNTLKSSNEKIIEKIADAEFARACPYTRCYCEENVWQQCRWLTASMEQSLPACNPDSFYAMFISNHNKDTLFLNHGGRAHTRWVFITAD